MDEVCCCPYCGGQAVVFHDYDTYDRADYGWSVSCGRYSLFDKVHKIKTGDVPPKVYGYPSKEIAINQWNALCKQIKNQKTFS